MSRDWFPFAFIVMVILLLLLMAIASIPASNTVILIGMILFALFFISIFARIK